MTLHLDVPAPTFVVDEPIPLALRFVNGGAESAFPLDHEAGDVVTVHLFDGGGRYLGPFNGYTQDIRLGLEPAPAPQETRPTVSLPPGFEIAWRVDLLSYTDLPEGTYAVEVEIRFRPGGIQARSRRVGLEVVANHGRAQDAIVDVVATPVLHTAQVHEDGEGARLLVHLRPVLAPGRAWSAGAMRVARGIEPRVAEADFATRATFAHDFARWVAWTTGGSLALRCFRQPSDPAEDGWGPLFERALPHPDALLLGRPIQHEDGSASVFLGHRVSPRAWSVSRWRCDAAGVLLAEGAATELSIAAPAPAVTGSDGAGRVCLAWGDAGQLPLRWASAGAEVATILDAAAVRSSMGGATCWSPSALLGVRLELKPHRDVRGPAVLAAVLLSDGERRALWFARAPLEGPRRIGPWHPRVLALPTEAFSEGESLVTVDLATSLDRGTVVLAITSQGQILDGRRGDLRPVARLAPDVARYASLVTIDGACRILLPSDGRGLSVE